MKTNVVIDDAAVKEAAEILGTKGRSETLRAAVNEVVRRYHLKELAESSVSYEHTDPDVLAQVNKLAWK